jgi:hypothetical protein
MTTTTAHVTATKTGQIWTLACQDGRFAGKAVLERTGWAVYAKGGEYQTGGSLLTALRALGRKLDETTVTLEITPQA